MSGLVPDATTYNGMPLDLATSAWGIVDEGCTLDRPLVTRTITLLADDRSPFDAVNIDVYATPIASCVLRPSPAQRISIIKQPIELLREKNANKHDSICKYKYFYLLFNINKPMLKERPQSKLDFRWDGVINCESAA